jgi:hypothetical protein
MRNTFEKCGYTGGEAMNSKAGTIGDFAYNLCIGMATNGPKVSNINVAVGKPSSNVRIYNNTMINCGYRRSAAGRGGSINFEEGAGGMAYNNLIVNCKFGLRVVNSPIADTANLKYGYNFYYADSISVASQFIPSKSVSTAIIQQELISNILLIIATTIIAGFLTFLMRQTLIVMSRHIEFDLKNEVFRQYENLSQNFFKQNLNRFVITHVTFKLPKIWQARVHYADLASITSSNSTPQAIFEAVCTIRSNKLPDPKVIGNAGSFFQNPLITADQYQHLLEKFPKLVSYPDAGNQRKLAAGWLIDQCGFKGQRLGEVGVYEKQALVIVNHGKGSAADILALAKLIQNKVHEQFGVTLEIEPNIL